MARNLKSAESQEYPCIEGHLNLERSEGSCWILFHGSTILFTFGTVRVSDSFVTHVATVLHSLVRHVTIVPDSTIELLLQQIHCHTYCHNARFSYDIMTPMTTPTARLCCYTYGYSARFRGDTYCHRARF
jgi:hypothetical protein